MKRFMDMDLFPNPSNPFESEHNYQVIRQKIEDGKLVIFHGPKNGVVYVTPDKAVEAILAGLEQMTLTNYDKRHLLLMQKYIAKQD